MEKKNKNLKVIKIEIKNKTYNWQKAIEDTAERILEYPQALLWR